MQRMQRLQKLSLILGQQCGVSDLWEDDSQRLEKRKQRRSVCTGTWFLRLRNDPPLWTVAATPSAIGMYRLPPKIQSPGLLYIKTCTYTSTHVCGRTRV
mmetsp:Transcript_11851/g.21690  ORF Transcript_11851/g.21690 Transcript_11851/m.21690 type:complete len:99 (+) Transcript_11851:2058-2354(+)